MHVKTLQETEEMKYEAYLFDLDGTLLNTLTDLATSVNYALTTHHLPPRNTTEIRKFLGNGIKMLIAEAVPANTNENCCNEVLKTFRAHYIQHCMDKTAPYEGIINVLEQLKANGAKLYIISNKPDNAVQELYKHYFSKYVDYAIGESENIRRKPCPDTLLAAINHAQVSHEKAVYIGDSEVDIETARRAHVDCISVTWGFRDSDFLIKSGATTLIDSPSELLDF